MATSLESLSMPAISQRLLAEAHRAQLSTLGLWGVPSFRIADTAVWGQDHLWALRQALQARL